MIDVTFVIVGAYFIAAFESSDKETVVLIDNPIDLTDKGLHKIRLSHASVRELSAEENLALA
jgi:hypothetical protein